MQVWVKWEIVGELKSNGVILFIFNRSTLWRGVKLNIGRKARRLLKQSWQEMIGPCTRGKVEEMVRSDWIVYISKVQPTDIANWCDIGWVRNRRVKDIFNIVFNISTSYSFHSLQSYPSNSYVSLESLQEHVTSWLVHLHPFAPFWVILYNKINVAFLKSQEWSHCISVETPPGILPCVRTSTLNEAFEAGRYLPLPISPATCHTIPLPALHIHYTAFLSHSIQSQVPACAVPSA